MEDKPPSVGCELGNLKEKNPVQRDANNFEFWNLLQHDEVSATSEEMVDLSENPNPTITIVKIYGPSSLVGGKAQINIHEEKCKLLQGVCNEGEGEV